MYPCCLQAHPFLHLCIHAILAVAVDVVVVVAKGVKHAHEIRAPEDLLDASEQLNLSSAGAVAEEAIDLR